MIDDEILFASPSNDNWGLFVFNPVGIISGTDRCDNGQYGPSIMLGEGHGEYSSTPFTSLKEVSMYDIIAMKPPHFCIFFHRLSFPTSSESPHLIPKLWKDIDENHPARYWMTSSLSEFLRVMWEWSKMAEEPFNSIEPQARVAKSFFDNVDIPNDILNEISNLPDMYIFKYVKGDPNARNIDSSSYPDISLMTKEWFKSFCLNNPHKKIVI